MRKISHILSAMFLTGFLITGGLVAVFHDTDTFDEGTVEPETQSDPITQPTPAVDDDVLKAVDEAATQSRERAVSVGSFTPKETPAPAPSRTSDPSPSQEHEATETERVYTTDVPHRETEPQQQAEKHEERHTEKKEPSVKNDSKKDEPKKKDSKKNESKKNAPKKNESKKTNPKKTNPKKNTRQAYAAGDKHEKKKTAQARPAAQHSGKITANFVFASNSVEKNAKMIRAMNADPITFGYRIKPARAGDYPKKVRKAIGSRKVYSYATGIQWVNGLSKNDRKVDGFTIVDVGHKSVVVVRSDIDPQKTLVEAAEQEKARVFLGMPAPQQKSYLPDLSYKGVVDNFVGKYVENYRAVGATGYYHHIEMPISGGSMWDGTRGLYAAHNQIVARIHPGAVTIIAPYLETRKAKHGATPAQSAAGAKKLMRTARGTQLFIAPQDGLGTDTTALRVDRSRRHVETTEDHFKAMNKAIGNRLWATTEVMRPAGGQNRTATNAHRVGQQLSAVKRYTRGSIGFMWNNGTGMRSVRGFDRYTVGVGQSFR